MTRPALLVVTLAACTTTDGNLIINLTSAPDAALLPAIERVRLTTTSPPHTYEATRGANGIDLAFEIDGVETPGIIFVEGYAADDALIAVGETPPFALNAADAAVEIFVAAPYSITQGPVALRTARADVGASPLLFGAVVAGGIAAGGETSAEIELYNAYNHTFSAGLEMPVHRRAPIVAGLGSGAIYLFGGAGPDGTDTSTLHTFFSQVAPSGAYSAQGESPALARSHQLAIPFGNEAFLVTGTPPATLANQLLTARTDVPALLPTGASIVVGTERLAASLRADASGLADAVVLLAPATAAIVMPLPAPLARAALVAQADGTLVVVGGGSTSALLASPVTRMVSERADVLSTPRFAPTVATTARFLVIAGGVDATEAPIASADILDAVTLARVATVPYVPRPGGVAVTLPNEQIMFVGGETPTARYDLFTPPVPVSR